MWMLTSWVWLTLGSWKWSITSLCSWVRGLELLRLYPYCILRAEPVQLMDFTDGETEAHSKAVMCPRTPGKTMPEQEVAPRSLLWLSCSLCSTSLALTATEGRKEGASGGSLTGIWWQYRALTKYSHVLLSFDCKSNTCSLCETNKQKKPLQNTKMSTELLVILNSEKIPNNLVCTSL